MAQLIAGVGKAGADNILQASSGVTKAVGSQFPSMGDTARLISALRGVPGRVTPKASSTYWSKNDDDLASGLF